MRGLLTARTIRQKLTVVYTMLLTELLVVCLFWQNQAPQQDLGFFLLQSFFTSLISKLITVPHLLLVGRAFRTIQRVNHTAYSGELCIAKNLLMGGAGVVHTLMMCREGYCFWRWRQAVREMMGDEHGHPYPSSYSHIAIRPHTGARDDGRRRHLAPLAHLTPPKDG